MSSVPSRVLRSATIRRKRVVDAVKAAIATMEEEMRSNGGIYPKNGGRLSLAEVCRRAQVHSITLMGEAHRASTRVLVLEWVSSNAKSGARAKRDQKFSQRSKREDLHDSVKLLAARLQALHQVEIPWRDEEIERLKNVISTLCDEIAALRERLGELNVVSFNQSKRRR